MLARTKTAIRMACLQARLLFALVAFAACAPSAGWGCPFCSPVEGETLLSEVDRARAVVLGTLLQQPSESAQGERKRTAEFGIVQIARGGTDLDPSATIDVHFTISARIGSRHLLLQTPEGSGRWRRRFVSPEHWEFVRAAAKLPRMRKEMSVDDRVRRLAFCLPHLVSNSEGVSRSAYAEFAAAPYEAVKALVPHLDSSRLKTWIASEERTSPERSLMFVLLAVCGGADDVEFVKGRFLTGLKSAKSTELASIIAAWLSITGPEGLSEIDRRLLEPADVPSTTRRAAVEALRFHANVEGTVIDRSRLLASARLLLAHPEAADYIIGDLAEWKDWQSLETILALYNKHGDQAAWLKRPILKYLEACPLPAARSALAAINRAGRLSLNDHPKNISKQE